MFYDFQIEYVRNYTVLRDYLEKINDEAAIRFVLVDNKTGEVVTKVVLIQDFENDGEWKKTKVSKQADYIRITVEEGDENKMVEEIGKVKKKGAFDREIKIDVKQYRYFLKKKD